jgi:hypothetical protein
MLRQAQTTHDLLVDVYRAYCDRSISVLDNPACSQVGSLRIPFRAACYFRDSLKAVIVPSKV